MQVGSDPYYYAEHGEMRPTFTNRDSQMLLNDYSVHVWRSCEPWKVYFKFAYSWWQKLPIIGYFQASDANEEHEYAFNSGGDTMLITRSTIAAGNEAYQGYYLLSFGQNSLDGTKVWTKKSIFELISDIGGLGISIAAFL